MSLPSDCKLAALLYLSGNLKPGGWPVRQASRWSLPLKTTQPAAIAAASRSAQAVIAHVKELFTLRLLDWASFLAYSWPMHSTPTALATQMNWHRARCTCRARPASEGIQPAALRHVVQQAGLCQHMSRYQRSCRPDRPSGSHGALPSAPLQTMDCALAMCAAAATSQQMQDMAWLASLVAAKCARLPPPACSPACKRHIVQPAGAACTRTVQCAAGGGGSGQWDRHRVVPHPALCC